MAKGQSRSGGGAKTTRRKKSPDRKSTDSRLRRHAREICGLLLIALGVLLSLALLSYHPTDPSFNTASSEPVRNWIGQMGAALADQLFQLLGVTSFVTAGVALVFGGRLLLRRRSPVRWPELVGLGSIVVLVAILAQLVVGSVNFRGEPLPTGGALGEILVGLLAGVLGRIGTGVVSACALLITLKLALDISLAEIARWLRGPATRAGRWLQGQATATGARLRVLAGDGRRALAARWADHKDAWAQRRAARVVRKRQRIEEQQRAQEKRETEAEADVCDAVLDSIRTRAVPPRIVMPEPPGLPGEIAAQDGSGGDETGEVISLEKLDQVESEELSQVSQGGAPQRAQVRVEVTGRSDGAPATPDEIPAAASMASLQAVEGVRAGDAATSATAGGPRIVESEHLLSEPRTDVDSLRGWAADVEFKVPTLSLLDPLVSSRFGYSEAELHENARRLEHKLKDYGIEGHVVEIHPGPVITMYEFEPAPGIKVARIVSLHNDLTMALKAKQVRIIAPLPGKGVVGIEVPNKKRETVYLREVLVHGVDEIRKRKLPIALGKDIVGRPSMGDLAKMPHLLIAGTTGSGKSVAVSAMLMSLLLSRTPDEVRMILIDPKMIEFSAYDEIPHLLLPVVTDPKKAAHALRWAVGEMIRRYEMLKFVKKQNIVAFNNQMEELQAAWEKDGDAALPWDPEDEQCPFQGVPPKLPYIVIVIDELADLMMVARKDVEDCLVRLAQLARAAGIHLLVATQRPSVDVITGLIKANFSARQSFRVSSKVDSRTVLDANGAESLLGMGDMLMLKPGTSELQRIHAPLVTMDEIMRVTDDLREQAAPAYLEDVLEGGGVGAGAGDAAGDEDYDELYDQAVAIVSEARKASTSMLQRRLKIGYNRAARLIEKMEEDGVVGPADGVKPRQVFAQSFGAEP